MNTEPRKKKKKGGVGKLRLHTLWAKPYRFSAHVTEEQDWHTEVPNVRLARVFGIVLILHVVAVGGILAFKMIEKSSSSGEGPSVTDPGATDQSKNRVAATIPEVMKQKANDGADVNVIVDDPSRLGMKHYRVRSGDNLLAVARRLGVSVSELEELNKLNNGNELYAGQVLLVPNRKISALPAEDIQRLLGQPISDKIVKAETEAAMAAVVETAGAVAEIAEKAVAAGGVVLKAKPIDGGSVSAPILKPVLAPAITPALPTAPVTVKAVPAPDPVPSNSKSYVVQPGDTPYGIGRRFNVNPSELMRANGISDPRLLKVGAELRIP